MRAAFYARVSRADQNSGLQRDAIRALVQQRGWQLVATFTDDGISGATDKRPAFRELVQAAKSGAFDVLVVYKCDRLFRSTRELLATLADFDAWGVKFISVTEPFDTSSPSGKLLLTLLAGIAEFERDLLRERTRAGVAAARNRGKQLGRPKRQIDRELVARRRAQTPPMPWAAIARELEVSERTLMRTFASS